MTAHDEKNKKDGYFYGVRDEKLPYVFFFAKYPQKGRRFYARHSTDSADKKE